MRPFEGVDVTQYLSQTEFCIDTETGERLQLDRLTDDQALTHLKNHTKIHRALAQSLPQSGPGLDWARQSDPTGWFNGTPLVKALRQRARRR